MDGIDIAVLDGAFGNRLDVVLDERPVATPPVWKVRIVSCVPGSPMDWAAMMPTASPSSTRAVGASCRRHSSVAQTPRGLSHVSGERTRMRFKLQFLELSANSMVIVWFSSTMRVIGDRGCGWYRGRFGRRSCP